MIGPQLPVFDMDWQIQPQAVLLLAMEADRGRSAYGPFMALLSVLALPSARLVWVLVLPSVPPVSASVVLAATLSALAS
jgi:hypothetical protein